MKEYKVSIIGMGALGLLYGNYINEHKQEAIDAGIFKDIQLEYVLDYDRFKRYENKKIICNGNEMKFTMTQAEKATAADLVIVATKSTGLESALDNMEKCVDEHTTIISVLNGIASEEIIGKRFGSTHVIDTVAQGMDAMKLGDNMKYSRMGELCIGIADEKQRQRLNDLKMFFDSIGMPYTEEQDIRYRMWSKFMLNVGVNQVCMVCNTNYAEILTPFSEENRMFIGAMREVIAIAQAENVALTEADLNAYVKLIQQLNPTSAPSMAQDRMNGKKSEVESFAGTVIRIAKKHGILVPTNEYLYKKVLEIEDTY